MNKKRSRNRGVRSTLEFDGALRRIICRLAAREHRTVSAMARLLLEQAVLGKSRKELRDETS